MSIKNIFDTQIWKKEFYFAIYKVSAKKIFLGGGGVTMLFHAFRVVYTVKELDSHAKHRQSLNKQFGHIAEYFCAKNLTSGIVQVSESFFRSWLLLT